MHIFQTHLDIFIKFSGFSVLIDYSKVIDGEKPNPRGSKICIFQYRPIDDTEQNRIHANF